MLDKIKQQAKMLRQEQRRLRKQVKQLPTITLHGRGAYNLHIAFQMDNNLCSFFRVFLLADTNLPCVDLTAPVCEVRKFAEKLLAFCEEGEAVEKIMKEDTETGLNTTIPAPSIPLALCGKPACLSCDICQATRH